MARLTIAKAALAATLAVSGPPVIAGGLSPDVAAWIETVGSTAAPAAARSEAIDALRTVADGSPRETPTREAIFALALGLTPEDEVAPGEALKLAKSAASFYPEDSRTTGILRRIVTAQFESGERLAAHFTFTHLLEHPDAAPDDVLVSRAAANAIAIGDPTSAWAWSDRVDADALPAELRTGHWIVRLTSAATLRRYSDANTAHERLIELDPRALRRSAEALLAAARTEAALGQRDDAIGHMQAFVNIHSRHAERPAALLELGRLLGESRQAAAAMRTFDWLVADHPTSREAADAHLERVTVAPDLSPLERAEAYRLAASATNKPAIIEEACRRILQGLLAEGEAVAALSLLGWVAKDPTSLSSAAARKQFIAGLGPAIELLSDRGDDVGLAAVATEADSLGIAIPASHAARVRDARRNLALGSVSTDRIAAAARHARSGRWDEVVATLDEEWSEPSEPDAAAERDRWLAEAEWRRGDSERALARLDGALASRPADSLARPLLVLRADIRLTTGDSDAACSDYHASACIAASPWVDRRLRDCDPSPVTSEGAVR